MTASFPNNSLDAARERSGRWAIALALPLVAAAIQWQLWPYISPFAWLLFYPAVFFAANIDGRRGTFLSAIVSIPLVIYLFLPPQLSWQVANPNAWVLVVIFTLMAIAFSETFVRLRLAEAQRLHSITQQHEADRTREGEVQFRQLVEGLPQLVWATTPAGVCDFLSRQWTEFTGIALDRQPGLGWVEAIHPDDRDRLWSVWSQSLATGTTYRVEHRLQHVDGSYRWFDTQAMPLRDEDGRIVRWFGASTDIQPARDAALLAERQARLLEIAYDPIILWSADRGIEFWNDGATQLYGYTAEEAKGKSTHELLHTVFPDGRDAALATLHSTGLWSGEIRHVTRGGAPVIVTSRLQQIEMDGRRVVLEANRDITTEKAQQVEVQRWADAFTYCTHGLAVGLPGAATLLASNPAFATLVGSSSRELAGLALPDVFIESDRAPIRECIQRADQDGQARLEAHVAKAADPALPVQVDIASVRGAGGEIIYRVVTMQDISGRRQAEAQVRQLTVSLERQVTARTAELRSANAELESFAYAVSHDLRAPLRAMSGFSTALIEDYGGKLDGEAQVYLQQIILGSRQMANLIDGLLVLSRTTRGELVREPVDLTAVASRVWAQLQQADRSESPRQVDFLVEPGLKVMGDPRMIEVLVRNLLENAWKYTGRTASPRVRMMAVPEAPGTFRIEDNGAGFDNAHAGKLFQPFQRLHRQEEFQGTGIGLATVQRIVRRHGGEIRASGEVGHGATFTFTLPTLVGETAT